MGVLHVISFFLPSAGDEYKNHPSRHGSIALPVPDVSKISLGAICFTSSDSNGGLLGGSCVFTLFYATYA